MRFAIEAMKPDGTTVREQLEASDRTTALDTLRSRGLLVTRIDERGGTAAPAQPIASGGRKAGATQIRPRDMMLLTRQLKMLLESGAPLVTALEAVEEQTGRGPLRALLGRLRERIEGGERLAEALRTEGRAFDPVFRGMVAAGEATGALPAAFAQLSDLAQQKQRNRGLLIGAMIYPAILSLLLVGVVILLLVFVVPRFRVLFIATKAPLPPTTQILFHASQILMGYWPLVALGAVLVVGSVVASFYLPQSRRALDEVLLRLPLVGKLASRLIFARVVRIWAAMLRCHVPLLEALQQSRDAVSNAAYLRLIDQVHETVSGGGRMAQGLASAGIADPIIVSALRIGEENGRLAEATDFISNWLDEENTQMVQSLTRSVEPVMLAFMGIVVGLVAMSLFLPLFDLATAAH